MMMQLPPLSLSGQICSIPTQSGHRFGVMWELRVWAVNSTPSYSNVSMVCYLFKIGYLGLGQLLKTFLMYALTVESLPYPQLLSVPSRYVGGTELAWVCSALGTKSLSWYLTSTEAHKNLLQPVGCWPMARNTLGSPGWTRRWSQHTRWEQK